LWPRIWRSSPFLRWGKYGALLVALVSQDRDNYRFVWWQGAGLPQPEGNFDLLFHARVNNYKGKVDVQFEWEEFRDSQEEVATTRRKGKILLSTM